MCSLLAGLGLMVTLIVQAEEPTSAPETWTPPSITVRAAMDKAHALFAAQCGHPSRCSYTRDGRGACPHTIILLLPEGTQKGMRMDDPANPDSRKMWICLNEQGGLIGTHRGDSPPWQKG